MARVLILGGVGFIGRNLVQYLISNNLASKICVADKVLPEVAGLNETELAMFKGEKVTFKQCNLARDGSSSFFGFVVFFGSGSLCALTAPSLLVKAAFISPRPFSCTVSLQHLRFRHEASEVAHLFFCPAPFISHFELTGAFICSYGRESFCP